MPGTDNQKFFAAPTGTSFGETVYPVRKVEFYQTHDLSARRIFDDWSLQIGIQNVFDEAPNYISASSNATRVGNFRCRRSTTSSVVAPTSASATTGKLGASQGLKGGGATRRLFLCARPVATL
ncbi:MAG: TonB-dependent receptor [Terricaulis sp.]|nr:TonB-dependent receptor [Terricaulis sp.]